MRKLFALSSAFILVLTMVGRADAAGRRSDPAFKAEHGRPHQADTGGTCPSPPIVAALPFTDADDTCRIATNVITNYGGVCNTALPFPYPGPEVVYRLDLGTGNTVDFSADLTGSTGDLAIFVVGSACGNGTNCVANSQDAVGPGAGPEVIAAAAYTPGTYFVYMDSYYAVGTAGACGTYTLTITGTLPVELMEFTAE